MTERQLMIFLVFLAAISCMALYHAVGFAATHCIGWLVLGCR